MHHTPEPIPDTSEDAARITDGIRRGDRAAFSLFYSLVATPIFDATKALTRRDEQFCLDVLQETLMRAISSIPSLSSMHALHAWTLRTAHSIAIDLLRKEWRALKRDRTAARPELHTHLHAPHDELAWLTQQLAALDPATELWLRQHLGHESSLDSLAQRHASDPQPGAPLLTRDAIYGRIRRAIASLRRAAHERFTHD